MEDHEQVHGAKMTEEARSMLCRQIRISGFQKEDKGAYVLFWADVGWSCGVTRSQAS